MGDLSGKVAIVTGAGRGLGREEAIQLARQGARVVINDINLPAAVEASHATVADIKALGGEAIAVFGDCADSNDSDTLFKTALETFGDVNIVVNNAGFCRDKTIFAMSDDEFDSVVRVHLRGHFVNMRNATKYWREKAKAGPVYGRLVSTASESMLYGTPGQPNYAAAKAGIVAMTMGAAQLMIKYGITANVIMPRARTDMTAAAPSAPMFAAPEKGFDVFNPENVAPLVGYLASPESGHISGEVFVVWGGQVTVVQRPTLGTSFNSSNGGKWELDDMHKVMSTYFNESHKTVVDGYTMPV
ncbi:SDR family NAD(P)-dependent oxidoreductase [Denitratisoma oestradiolicum]|uniref:3-oxoacyl-ACP reductase n=1 Tax=Denitratisoma oestradiolicum TaxID=311182 RepID=A0A6S6Y1Q6_9PROT|nr:SDR family NAD(P)-dependent oxidoreductase [Denitratisoma oestradiolicum]TWO82259.1 3-oxoacyl-ACP reductase [Denitratisoma oestradiolicum]CAB1369211.1 3-oxoacyl-ACP reductase [Denitratisoma oestradiolicum]